MLTRELLRVRKTGEYLHPRFVPTDDPKAFALAKDLLELYAGGIGRSREYLENASAALALSFRDRKLAEGICKVLADRARFTAPASEDARERRRKVFEESAEAIRAGRLPESPFGFRDSLASAASLSGGLYDDLPEKDTLKSLPPMFPREVLERYNMALVQTLLLHAEKLDLEIPADSEPPLLRSLCRFLRFFRLLVSAEKKDSTLFLTVSGPADIFENTTRYGLQTASFFPIVCRLPRWRAACRIRGPKQTGKLRLDQTSGLVCHFSNDTSYRPEEFAMFASLFRKEVPGWELDPAPGFLTAEGGKLIFPDFAFRSAATGRIRYLELFHRWHRSSLTERLKDCAEGRFPDLLLGVDRALLKKDGILSAALSADEYFQTHGFFFRDFPGVKNVSSLLDSMLL